MQDFIIGLFLLGCISGVIPVIALLLIIKVFAMTFKGAEDAVKVLKSDEEPVKRDIAEELREKHGRADLDQFIENSFPGMRAFERVLQKRGGDHEKSS